MPNWVTNYIELEGDEKRIAEMKEAIKKDDYGLGTVDFNNEYATFIFELKRRYTTIL